MKRRDFIKTAVAATVAAAGPVPAGNPLFASGLAEIDGMRLITGLRDYGLVRETWVEWHDGMHLQRMVFSCEVYEKGEWLDVA